MKLDARAALNLKRQLSAEREEQVLIFSLQSFCHVLVNL